ncbi:hypothetical protein SeMB42_g05732 [Synchytrium endobioticum]|uniref:Uncharacterized protein n=1 Tax=Synchytrium endobioticum TaxID=286115 RepID=A0A507CPN4_9FUNG|nr:hypothetical protein SeLEV6574_g07631 [Synchytrium endobioticum]TPX41091.1 hypothetical protein SeMB42_g05732 [Synchytrium endobioticum]
MDVLGKAFADYARRYRSITWRHVLGNWDSHYLEKIASAHATAPLQYEHEASIQADPRKVEGIPDYVISLFHLLPTPENVPPEYLELATRFHQLVVDRGMNTEGERNEEFNLILGDASILWQNYGDAYAASSPYSAGSTDDGSWAQQLLGDAKQLRLTYAKAADARYGYYAESLREHREGVIYDKYWLLVDELTALYSKWKTPNNPYGSEITSITSLLIERLIPKDIPFTEANVKEPNDDMSPSHNEFVWEGLRTLDDLAYLRGDDVDRKKIEYLNVLKGIYAKEPQAQVRSDFFGSVDVFSPPESFNMLASNIELAQIKEALKSGIHPTVSTFTQAELIEKRSHSDWRIGSHFGIEVFRLGTTDRDPRSMSNYELVSALVSLQLVVGRAQLMESSLSAFLEQRKHLPQTAWLKSEINHWENFVDQMRKTTEKYQWYVRKCMMDLSNRWIQALGTQARHYLEIIESELETHRCGGDVQTSNGIPDGIL